MTFTEIVAEIAEHAGRSSSTTTTRIGRGVNARYRRLTSSLGIKSRQVFDVSGSTSIGSKLVTFTGIEQIHRLIDARDLTAIKVLDEVTIDELRNETADASDTPARWAVYRVGSGSVTVLLDAQAQTVYALLADGLESASTLSGSTSPAFPESFHDILVEGGIAEEMWIQEKPAIAKAKEAMVKARTSELRLHLAVSPGLTRRQGEREGGSSGSAGSSGGANSGAQLYTQTGLITFDRDPSAPFAVTSGSAYVDNLIADDVYVDNTDRLIGRDTAGAGTSEEITVGGGIEFTGSAGIQTSAFTGDVTKAAGGTAQTIANDAVTFAKIQNIATDSLLGRDAASTGDVENILLNATLSMDGAGNLQRAALTGDVTASAGSNATTIANDAVTYAKMQNTSAASRLLGRGSASGAGDVEEITLSGLSMVGTVLTATAATQSGVEQAFRGLHLRTSPNADVAATTVSVLGLTQWTADDGTLVDDTLTNNTAVISSSGAGGLDTGAEAASTWYEIYRIRKSSDGTLNTLLHRAKDYFLDESQTTQNDSESITYLTGNRTATAQTFDTDVTGYVEFVDVNLLKNNSPTGRIWAELRATSAGAPTGAALATSDKLDASLVSTSAQWVRFIFRTPISLTAGTTYALVLSGDWTQSDTVLVKWGENNTGGYAAGEQYVLEGGVWAAMGAGDDFCFKVYVTENDTAVTMPSGYDQKCKIGYVYNDSGSNFDPFVALGKTVILLANGTLTTSFTATVATLTDVSVFSPPTDTLLYLDVRNNTLNKLAFLGAVPDGYGINPAADNGRDVGADMVLADVATARILRSQFVSYQAMYLAVDAGTMLAYVNKWEWF